MTVGHRRSRLRVIAGAVGYSTLGLFAIGSVILQLIDDVRKGRGLDYYFNGMGVEMNAIGALITLMLLPVVLLIGWAIRAWSHKRELRILDELRHHRTPDERHTDEP